jgi:hypothetical protein
LQNDVSAWPLPAFLITFAVFWTIICSVLGAFAGWYGLAEAYRDRDERAFLKIGFQSAAMGSGLKVSMGGILTFSACPSGLRVSIWRVFGPFSKPFLVPWAEVRARRQKGPILFGAVLTLGHPQIGSLVINARTWNRLAKSARDHDIQIEPIARLSMRQLVVAILLQWAIAAAFLSFFLFSMIRQDGVQAVATPLIVASLFLACLTVIQIVRFLRELPPS